MKQIRIFIAEKPELAKAIANALGNSKRQAGYFTCGSDYVTWCVGHMLVLYDPEDYDLSYKRWNLQQLPIIHMPWKRKVLPDKAAQLNIIKRLLKQATEVIHAGDPDEEGQLLVDNVLAYFQCVIPVKRLLVNDNNIHVVKKSLQTLKNNEDFKGLSARAEARSVADQLYGYNMTRLYTVAAKQKGYQTVLSVGRVQTPILGLVVRRDQQHEQHQKSIFYTIKGQFDFPDRPGIKAIYQVQSEDIQDHKNRLISLDYTKRIAEKIIGTTAYIANTHCVDHQKMPPLPYNLLKLQTDANRKFQIKPHEVLSITQRLREVYQLITYNRSDCQYLSDEHHPEAYSVLQSIAATAPILSAACQKANPLLKSKAFNSKKVSAHHAIIPTQKITDLTRLSDREKQIYLLIARSYIAQFFPVLRYQEAILMIECNTHPQTHKSLQFKVTNRRILSGGWSVLYKNDIGNEECKKQYGPDLSCFYKTMQGICSDSQLFTHETSALPYYTVHSLLKDLTCISKYAKNSKIKTLLKDKDQGKLGESGGIGTPATRSYIIKQLFDRQFLQEKGKAIVSTTLGRQLYALLPEQATQPDMTALWHEQQKEIELGVLSIQDFILNLVDYLQGEVSRIRQYGLSLKLQGEVCLQCQQGVLVKRKSKYGSFTGCSRYPDCP
ncbi:MAG: DNA topoisomerase 3 [Endozoicomonadaceae bacterium]|nr:DNA topoisomerase 3 [Endozoicomonadaceae bacterium]